ncbi:hypothetical protein QQ045_022202 [Rhodiola kirilowii]
MGCTSTLGANGKEFFQRVAARDKHVRALFTEKLLADIEKEIIRLDEKFLFPMGHKTPGSVGQGEIMQHTPCKVGIPNMTILLMLVNQLSRDSGRNVEDPDLLEKIRLTIINNLLRYHPESSERLAMGEAFGIKSPTKKVDVEIVTHVKVKDDGPKRRANLVLIIINNISRHIYLTIETADRPGLLLEVVKIIADINIDVEIETEGLVAKDKLHVSYGGAALNKSLSQVITNCLRYYLRRPETDVDKLLELF